MHIKNLSDAEKALLFKVLNRTDIGVLINDDTINYITLSKEDVLKVLREETQYLTERGVVLLESLIENLGK